MGGTIGPTLAALLLAACGLSPGSPEAGGMRVVASFSILGDMVAQVSGERVAVHTLVPPGLDTHTFEALPSDSVALTNADLIFAIGLGFEAWLPGLAEAAGVQERLIALGETLPEEDLLHLEEGGEEAGEHPGKFDPHVWQDPSLTGQMVRQIGAALAQADPAGAAGYAERVESVTTDLETLDALITETLAGIPPERRRLVTSHDALAYFARRYDFVVVGTALGHSTETASPSAQDLAALIDELRARPVPALFGAFGEPDALLDQIAAEAGIPRIVPLYADSLGPPGSEGETHRKMMLYNAEVIAAALNP